MLSADPTLPSHAQDKLSDKDITAALDQVEVPYVWKWRRNDGVFHLWPEAAILCTCPFSRHLREICSRCLRLDCIRCSGSAKADEAGSSCLCRQGGVAGVGGGTEAVAAGAAAAAHGVVPPARPAGGQCYCRFCSHLPDALMPTCVRLDELLPCRAVHAATYLNDTRFQNPDDLTKPSYR